MASSPKGRSRAREIVENIGTAAMIVMGFLLIFFTVASRIPRASQAIVPGVAHADAPVSGDSSSGGGDSGGGDGAGGDSGCGGDGDGGGCGK